MKQVMKKVLAAALILAMVLSGTVTAFGETAAGGNEPKVQLNGENVVFKDAPVKSISGTTMVPFQTIMGAMEYAVSYDKETKTVTAKTPEVTITFVIGARDVTVTKNGTESIKKMDSAPFIDKATGKVYVPVRFFEKSLGYCVGWDAAEKTAVLIDPDTIFGTADKDFSIISKLMKSDLDMEKPYVSTGKFDMTLATPETGIVPPMKLSYKGDVRGIQQKSDIDMKMNLNIDLGDLLDSAPSEQKAQMEMIASMMKDIDMKIKMDGETGVTYFNSGIYRMIDPSVDENTWFKMNAFEPYESLGIDMPSLMALETSGTNLSEAMAKLMLAGKDSLNVSSYGDIKAVYGFAKNLIGDEAFWTQTGGSTTIYTLSLTKDSIYKAMAAAALSEGLPEGTSVKDLKDLQEGLNSIETLQSNIVIREKGDYVSYKVNGSLAIEGFKGSLDLSGDHKNANYTMTFGIEDLMNAEIKMDSHLEETSETPDVNPPAGAKILDYPTALGNPM